MRENILITGASSGLGAGMAREFAQRGRNLALCARRIDRLEALRNELQVRHPAIRVSIRPLDVNDTEAVSRTFDEFRRELGGLDRIIVNAGVGPGARVGTGSAEHNIRIAQTNFVAALAQCEAAIEIFREQNRGHLVTIVSMSAMRGLPRRLTVYGAAKAGLAALTEGIRAELLSTPIRVSAIFPGYIRTEMLSDSRRLPFEVDEVTGSRAMVAAIERESASATIPGWPWRVIGLAMRNLPLRVVARMS
ncbi:MAG: SDR family oxidoreductase [Gemmatimonadetes bacterium]|nr:SDR family oxidoreductase [Gemmatimonadota bacterium]